MTDLLTSTATDPVGHRPSDDVRPEPSTLVPVPLVALAIVVTAKVALGLLIGDRYGWHRDELYYRVAGLHPAWGYVDFPPITPALARVAEAIAPGNLVVLRSFAVLAGAAVVVLVALIARELGGGRRAQTMAAVLAGVAPFVYGSNALFQTVSFDLLAWAAVLLTVARLLRRSDARGWVPVGVAAGLALETKYTALVLLVSLAVGLVATAAGRAVLVTSVRAARGRRSLATGAALAAVLVAPNVWWQQSHRWPTIAFFADGHGGTAAPQFLVELALFAGPVGLAMAAIGLVALARDPRWRSLAVAAAAAVVLFLATGGKSYYAAPILLLAMAAGATAFEGRIAHRADGGRRASRVGLVAAVVAGLLVAPAVVPVLPVSTAARIGLVEGRQDWADEIGWPELAARVDAVFRGLAPDEQARAGILTANYGEAGAVSQFAPGLPEPASTQATHRFWDGGRPDATVVITVGFPVADVAAACDDVVPAGVVDNPLGIDNEERGAPIAVCRTRTSLAGVRAALTT